MALIAAPAGEVVSSRIVGRVRLPTPVGASLTEVTVMVKVWVALVSTPPLVVPPLSWRATVTVAVPLALGAAV